MGDPSTIEIDKLLRNELGEQPRDEDYGLYKKFNFDNGVKAYAKKDPYKSPPKIIFEFFLTTPTRELSKTISEVSRYFRNLESGNIRKGKKIVYRKFSDEQNNYSLNTDLGKLHFIRDQIILKLFAHYNGIGHNKTQATAKVVKFLKKLNYKTLGLKYSAKKRLLLYLRPDAVRKIIV